MVHTSSLLRLPVALARRALPFTVVAAGAAHAEAVPRIIGGTPEARIPAIGALLKNGSDFCTGTAISANVVLTAAHCLEGIWSGDAIEFFIGRDARDLPSGRRIRAREVHAHPSYDPWTYHHDIAVVVLESAVDVAPVPVRLAALPWIVGADALFVGYGVTSADGGSGVKRSVTMPIAEVDDYFIVNEAAGKNTCFGDSGGPALMDLGAGLEVIAVTSHGDAACAEDGYNSRSDVHADWILGQVAAAASLGRVSLTSGDDGAEDICADNGWYDDGACDPFCPHPDRDCEGEHDGAWSDDDGAWSDDDGAWSDDALAQPRRRFGCAGGNTPLGLVTALAALLSIARRRGAASVRRAPAAGHDR